MLCAFFLETGVLFQKVMTIATKSKKIADLLWRYSKFYYLEKSFCNILQMLHVSLYKYLKSNECNSLSKKVWSL